MTPNIEKYQTPKDMELYAFIESGSEKELLSFQIFSCYPFSSSFFTFMYFPLCLSLFLAPKTPCIVQRDEKLIITKENSEQGHLRGKENGEVFLC